MAARSIKNHSSGVILYDETIRQETAKDGNGDAAPQRSLGLPAGALACRALRFDGRGTKKPPP